MPFFYNTGILSTDIRARAGPGGTWAEKWCHRPSVDVPVAALGHPRLDFYDFFEDPQRHRKNNDFPNHPKSPKMDLSIEHRAFKGRFFMKKRTFGAPFCIDFSTFFKNCESVKSAAGRSCSAERATGVFKLGILLD